MNGVKALAVPLLILCTLCGFLVPLPATMLDALIVVNCILALVLLATVLYVEEPLELSALPGILLVAALFRIGLNISTTRMILVGGAEMSAIVESAGAIALQGSVVVGMTVFLIITLVQFVVISKGAERVAEVSARFVLDALPGRQMSIDADARAGVISVAQAMERRERLQTESRFYAALDGSMKFVKGDAIAGLGITAINLVGGFGIGVGLHGMGVAEAAATYSLLTVGDGLVSQVPSLLNSIAAGMLITKVSHSGNTLASDLIGQLAGKPPVRIGVGLVFGLLPLFFPLPIVPFLAPGLFLVLTAIHPGRIGNGDPMVSTETPNIIHPRSLVLQVIASDELVASSRADIEVAMSEAVQELRQRTGVCLDDIELSGVEGVHGIQLHFRGSHLGTFNLEFDSSDQVCSAINGFATWLSLQLEAVADELIDDRATRRIIAFHASNGFEIPADILPGTVSLTRVTSLLRALLRSKLSILQFDVIMQAVSEAAQVGADEQSMLRDVRISLKRQISARYAHEGVLSGFMLEPAFEQQLCLELNQLGYLQSLNSESIRILVADDEVLMCGAPLREGIEVHLKAARITRTVLAFEELLPMIKFNCLGHIEGAKGEMNYSDSPDFSEEVVC